MYKYTYIVTIYNSFHDDVSNVFQHFWVARDLFAFAFAFGSCLALSALCRLLPCPCPCSHPQTQSVPQQKPPSLSSSRTCNPRAKARQLLLLRGWPPPKHPSDPARASTWACDVILAPIIMKDLRHAGVIPCARLNFRISTQLTWCGIPLPDPLPTYLHSQLFPEK